MSAVLRDDRNARTLYLARKVVGQVQEAADQVLGTWSAWFAALVSALFAMHATAHLVKGQATYSDFIVGYLAWNAKSKTADYGLLFAFVAVFVASMAALAGIAVLLRRRVGPQGWEAFSRRMALCLIPAVVWLGTVVFGRNEDTSLLWCSPALLAGLALLAVAAGARGPAFWGKSAARVETTLSGGLIAAMAASFSALGVNLAFAKFAQFTGEASLATPDLGASAAMLAAAAALAAALAIQLLAAKPEALDTGIRRLLLVSQLGLPLLFLVVVPAPWLDLASDTVERGYDISTAGWVFPVLLVAAGYLGLAGKARRPGTGAVDQALSVWCLIGVLLFLKVPMVEAPVVPKDDYHFGEFLVPWWSFAQHGLIPFVDLAPARGLLNYLPGLLNALFLDGTAASLKVAFSYQDAIVLAASFPMIAAVIGVPAAFLAFLLMPVGNGMSEIDVLMTACLVLLCHGFLRWTPVRWSIVTLFTGIVAVLFGTGQGGLLAIALAPLGLVAVVAALRRQTRDALLFGGAALVGLGLLLAATPLGPMLLGAVRYGSEQSAMNTVANGIPWLDGFGITSGLGAWAWEGLRTSWIVVAGLAGVVAARAALGGAAWDPERRRRALAFALPVFILATVFVLRAAGRIDAGGMSRLGVASIWSWCLLAPLLVFAWWGRRPPVAAVLVAFLPAAMIAPYFATLDVPDFPRKGVQAAAKEGLTSGAEVGIPNFGTGQADPEHLARLVKTRGILDAVLAPDETYMDLSNRGAQYFYMDRPPPTETLAFYNLIHPRQQMRAVESLRRRPPPLALIASDTILHDGGPASLRAYLVYRHLALHYLPAPSDSEPKQIWMVEPGAVQRAGERGGLAVPPAKEDQLALLDKAFRVNTLDFIPSSWGDSADSLQRAMNTVAVLDAARPAGTNNVTIAPDGSAEVTGEDPQLIYDLKDRRLSGRDAGLLAFDFSCEDPVPTREKPPTIEIYWASELNPSFSESSVIRLNALNGRLIVPLDALPRWLLAEKITAMRLDPGDGKTCKAFKISNMAFAQRHFADEVR